MLFGKLKKTICLYGNNLIIHSRNNRVYYRPAITRYYKFIKYHHVLIKKKRIMAGNEKVLIMFVS